MKKLLLFDFDGTVIDGSAGIYNCIRYATDKLGLPPVQADVLPLFVGPSLFDSFLRRIENDAEKAEIFVRRYRERYSVKGKYEAVLYPGMEKLLRELKRDGVMLAVCSCKPQPYVEDIARFLGVYDCFDRFACVAFGDDSSDKTALAKACLADVGIPPEQAAFIGDRRFDVEAAHGAGITAIGVSYGFAPPGELEAAGADIIADSPETLGRLLREGTV